MENLDGLRRIAQDSVGRYWVSTVWVGATFETRVFGVGGSWSGFAQGYGSLREAQEGHMELVARMRETEYPGSAEKHRTRL
jgi:hypothetical protein